MRREITQWFLPQIGESNSSEAIPSDFCMSQEQRVTNEVVHPDGTVLN
jgi:hypothetical protein